MSFITDSAFDAFDSSARPWSPPCLTWKRPSSL